MAVVHASQTLTAAGTFTDTQTVVVGGKTYTTQTTLTKDIRFPCDRRVEVLCACPVELTETQRLIGELMAACYAHAHLTGSMDELKQARQRVLDARNAIAARLNG